MREIKKSDFTATEYSTETKSEYEFLKSQGIEPSYTKKNSDTGIRIYKYKKNTELFLALTRYFLDKEKTYSSTTIKGE